MPYVSPSDALDLLLAVGAFVCIVSGIMLAAASGSPR
jgi:hypothetical protein